MLIPIYGFLRGDTVGLLVLARGGDTVGEVAARLVQSASVRVAPPARVCVIHEGRALDPEITVAAAGIAPLCRLDVAAEEG